MTKINTLIVVILLVSCNTKKMSKEDLAKRCMDEFPPVVTKVTTTIVKDSLRIDTIRNDYVTTIKDTVPCPASDTPSVVVRELPCKCQDKVIVRDRFVKQVDTVTVMDSAQYYFDAIENVSLKNRIEDLQAKNKRLGYLLFSLLFLLILFAIIYRSIVKKYVK